MRTYVVGKDELLVLVSQIEAIQQVQDRVFRHNYITFGCHATDLRGNTLADLDLKVLAPAVLAEVVAARKAVKLVTAMGCDTNRACLTLGGKTFHRFDFCTDQ